jgi:hypothetical protein
MLNGISTMTALVIALSCLIAAPESCADGEVGEEASLSMLLSKKARWDENSRTLKLTGAGNFSRQDVSTIRAISRVKALHIAYTLEDDDLLCLRECPQIESIVLTGGHFTDQALPHLAAMPSLKMLELDNCQLTKCGIAVLSKMNLDSLSLTGVSLPKQAVENLKSVPSLRVLDMCNTSCVTELSGCRNLRVLNLRGVDRSKFSTNDIVTEIGGLKQLERLSLSVVEEAILPPSTQSWFTLDFANGGSLMATRHYPLVDQLTNALPDTKVSVGFENRSITFQGRNSQTTIRVN